MKSLRKLDTILTSIPGLRHFVLLIPEIEEIQKILKKNTPISMKDSFYLQTIDHDKAVLIARSGAAASKLRQLQKRLIKAIKQKYPKINSIKILVRSQNIKNKTNKKHFNIPALAQDNLHALTEKTSHPQLKSALNRLLLRNKKLKG